ncbi:MAG: class I SAM-dependent methyltransferase [Chlorobi bacterium]|nr:class I SAM-dependent methyltransferase [Chlorobiota bacterium]
MTVENNSKQNNEKKSSYGTFFSNIYDPVFFPFLHPLRKKITEIVLSSKEKNVIDICCGTGNQLKYLRKAGIQSITGIDISENMIKKAAKNNVETYCLKKDAANTGFETSQFDTAILSFILHETKPETAREIMKETRRIVKNKGKIIIADYVFDEKTSFPGKIGSRLVEGIIGGEHYENFNRYIKHNLLADFTKGLKQISEYGFVFGALRIKVFEN